MIDVIKVNGNVIKLVGKIDSSCSAEFEKMLFEAVEGKTGAVLDCNELSYITSAGLRIVLKLKKTIKDVSLINVSSEIYEIFEMTGFAEILTIQKKRRSLSCEGCSEIARGAMGIIYRLDPDTILKVYDKSIPLDSLYQGQEVLKKLFINDIPCAIPFDIVDVGGSHGAVYEMLNADTLGRYITKNPDSLEECARKAALLLKELHQSELPDGILPSVKDNAASWLVQLSNYLTEEDVAAYKKLFASFKDTKNFLHLDFHTKNVMIKDGELMIIDLDDACVGDPMFDIACLLMTFGQKKWDDEQCMHIVGMNRAQMDHYSKVFFETYFDTYDEAKIAETLESLKPITALRTLYARAYRVGLTDEERKRLTDDALDFIHSTLYR